MLVAQGSGEIDQVHGIHSKNGPTYTKFGAVPKTFIAPALAIGRNGTVWALTAGDTTPGASTLYRFSPGGRHRTAVANIADYQKTDPDPYDLESNPTDSDPYGVAVDHDGSVLVADAAGNDLLRVTPDGKVSTVARVKPRTIPAPEGLPDGPPAGTLMPTEAVVTSVTVGADGSYYIGELRGFPGTPGYSQIWRIEPDASGAVCDPESPDEGDCELYADGFTSIVALAAGHCGRLYVAELSKQSWLAIEDPNAGPDAFVGAVIRVGKDTDKRKELKPGKILLPGGLAIGRDGGVYESGPVFGPGAVRQVGWDIRF
jgi:hypothetical protein